MVSGYQGLRAVTTNGYRISFSGDENGVKLNRGQGYNYVTILKSNELYGS